MATRFRRSKKILPGVKLNVNKNSVSMTVGPRWLHKTYSTTGRTTTTVSLPGTGLSASSTSSANATAAEEREPAISPKSRTIALILCFTVFGHRIYAGKYGSAVLYLFTAGLFSIGWVYDLIKICAGKFTDENGDYIQQWWTPGTKTFLIVLAALVVLSCILRAVGLV